MYMYVVTHYMLLIVVYTVLHLAFNGSVVDLTFVLHLALWWISLIMLCTCIVHIFMYILYTHRHVLGHLMVLWCTFSNYLHVHVTYVLCMYCTHVHVHVLAKLNIEIFDLLETNQWILCRYSVCVNNIHVCVITSNLSFPKDQTFPQILVLFQFDKNDYFQLQLYMQYICLISQAISLVIV